MASASQPAAMSPHASERSPAEHALGVPLIAERIAHFVQQQLTPEELARAERGFNSALRAALTPHWKELCRALSPGVVAFREQEGVNPPPYRRLYWQLRAMADQRPLMPSATYTFVADVVFRSGEHVSTWSAAFNWPEEHVRPTMLYERNWVYELYAKQVKRSPCFHFVVGDLKFNTWDPQESMTATLHVLRDDGAMARLQTVGYAATVANGFEGYAEGAEIVVPLELRFIGFLSSDQNRDGGWEIELLLYLGLVDKKPLVNRYKREDWGDQFERRFEIMQDCDLRNGWQTTLTLLCGYKEDENGEAMLEKTIASYLDSLAWLLPS
jgi:hypothetical protein